MRTLIFPFVRLIIIRLLLRFVVSSIFSKSFSYRDRVFSNSDSKYLKKILKFLKSTIFDNVYYYSSYSNLVLAFAILLKNYVEISC